MTMAVSVASQAQEAARTAATTVPPLLVQDLQRLDQDTARLVRDAEEGRGDIIDVFDVYMKNKKADAYTEILYVPEGVESELQPELLFMVKIGTVTAEYTYASVF